MLNFLNPVSCTSALTGTVCLLISQCSTKWRCVRGTAVCACVLRIAVNHAGCYVWRSHTNTNCYTIRNGSCPVNTQTVLNLTAAKFCTFSVLVYVTNQMHTSNVYKQYRHNCGMVGCDSSVGIATRYWLDGPGIESRWGRDFPHSSRPTLRPTKPPIQWIPGLSRG